MPARPAPPARPPAGVPPSRIIFAHPCKRPCDIRYAREKGITLTTFDTESELHKMAALNPAFRCGARALWTCVAVDLLRWWWWWWWWWWRWCGGWRWPCKWRAGAAAVPAWAARARAPRCRLAADPLRRPPVPPRPARCVLRIRADDPDARVPLGLKYGCNPEEAPRLLAVAKSLGLQVRRLAAGRAAGCWACGCCCCWARGCWA
jgi:hypothetical protein